MKFILKLSVGAVKGTKTIGLAQYPSLTFDLGILELTGGV